MASLNELRKKISGIKSTRQITRAMKMIAGVRLYRARKQAANAKVFAESIGDMLSGLAASFPETDKPLHPLFKKRGTGKIGIVVITSDKGLCGVFNHGVIRYAEEFMARHADQGFLLYIIGRKAGSYFRRKGLPIEQEYSGIFFGLNFPAAEKISGDIVRHFNAGELSRVIVIYNEMKSIIKQEAVERELLPLSYSPQGNIKSGMESLYEPSKSELLESLGPRSVNYTVFRMLAESYAAELAARMTAMDNASRNADDLIDNYTFVMNQVRQTTITRELADIVGTSEVLR